MCPYHVCMHIMQSLQSCLTHCDPMDCSSPGSSVHGILQARILEWVAMPFSRGSSQPRGLTHLSWILCIAGRFSPAEPYHEDISSSALERPMGQKLSSIPNSQGRAEASCQQLYAWTTYRSINSSALSFLHSPTLTSIHDHWKNHSLD